MSYCKRFTPLFVLIFALFTPLQAKLILDDGTPNPSVISIYNALGQPHDGTLQSLHTTAQSHFIRKKGLERWQVSPFQEDKRSQLLPLLDALHMVKDIHPSKKYYDVILIHGANVSEMRMRVKFLDELWSQGLRAREIVFLTGQRLLDPHSERPEVLFNADFSSVPFRPGWQYSHASITTESQAAQLIWDQIIINDDLRNAHMNLISVPYILVNEVSGEVRRPNTADTVQAWAQDSPRPANYLAISSNPYIGYQDAATRLVLLQYHLIQRGAHLETVGHSAPEAKIALYLDTLARQLYCELQEHSITQGQNS